MQTTLVILKPDCIIRGLTGEIIDRFLKRGLKIVGIKQMRLSDKLLTEHYAHLKEKPFFPSILKSMQRAPVILLALRGLDAANVARSMAGTTNSREAAPGTIRGDYGVSIQNNLVHISDSSESAETEVKRFFKAEELIEPAAEEFSALYSPDELA